MCIRDRRIPVRQMRAEGGGHSELLGSATREMSSLRRHAGEAPLVTGVPVQGLGLLCDGLREIRREAGRFFERETGGRRRHERSRSRDEGRFGGTEREGFWGFFEREEGFQGFFEREG